MRPHALQKRPRRSCSLDSWSEQRATWREYQRQQNSRPWRKETSMPTRSPSCAHPHIPSCLPLHLCRPNIFAGVVDPAHCGHSIGVLAEQSPQCGHGARVPPPRVRPVACVLPQCGPRQSGLQEHRQQLHGFGMPQFCLASMHFGLAICAWADSAGQAVKLRGMHCAPGEAMRVLWQPVLMPCCGRIPPRSWPSVPIRAVAFPTTSSLPEPTRLSHPLVTPKRNKMHRCAWLSSSC